MRMRRGFTIIEVSLFIAITALLFVGITVGTQNSINQQRYSDTVNDFTDFLRNIYSEVANPQSRGRGNSEQAIYGKLVMFGQLNEEDKIYVYDVVGNVEGKYSDDSLTTELKNLNATILSYRTSINDRKQILMSFNPEDVDIYTPKWGSKIEGLTKGSVAKLSLLVVRHPKSGTINTLVSTTPIDGVEETLNYLWTNNTSILFSGGVGITIPLSDNCIGTTCKDVVRTVNTFNSKFKNSWSSYSYKTVDFCVNPFSESDRRQNIRIVKDARNSSGVEVLDLDDENNICNKV